MAKKPKSLAPIPRTRISNQLVDVTAYEEGRQTNCSTPNWGPTGASRTLKVGRYKKMDDWVIPGYRERSAKGEVFFNPVYNLTDEYSDLGGQGYVVSSIGNTCTTPAWKAEYRCIGNPLIFMIQGQPLGGGIVPDILPALEDLRDIADLRTELSTRVYSERGRSESNLWETLAEFDQTVGMMHRPLGRLHNFLDKVDQSATGARKIRRTLGGVANLWLAYRYGLRPLIADIANTALGLDKPLGRRRQTTRAKGATQRTKTYSYSRRFGMLDVAMSVECTASATLRAMALDDFTSSRAYELGFTPKGIITLPWELVNSSFVADWFLNVGDYIGSLVPAVGWNLLGSQLSQVTQTISVTRIVSVTNNLPNSYTINTAPSGAMMGVRTVKTRGPLAQPGLVVKNDFRFDNVTRVLDSLTLASQRMGVFR